MAARSIPIAALLIASMNAAHADLSISNKATHDVGCSAGVCTATAKNAVLNAGDLTNMLASGGVAVKTGAFANDIDVDQPLTWANTSRLTLDARRSVIVKKAVTVTGTGALTITTNDGASGGVFVTTGNGRINFWDTASALVINNNSYALVSSVAALANAATANPTGNFALANNYDAKPDGVYPATPIAVLFKGAFEGLGNTVTHLKVNDTMNYGAGLFSQLYFSSVVENLNLENVNIQGTDDGAGALTGLAEGTVRNVTSSGKVKNTLDAGGLIGDNGGNVIASSSSCKVNGGYAAGGLVGNNAETIASSHASGSVTGTFAGGLVGFGGAFITQSSASGAVTGSINAGGLIGYAIGTEMDRSSATGSVSGDFSVGGIVGYLEGGSITQTFATGAVSGGNYAGGFAGLICSCESAVSTANNYATGSVSGASSGTGGFAGGTQQSEGVSVTLAYSTGAVSPGGSTGGFVGNDGNANDLAGTDWDLDTSGISNPAQGAGNIPNDPGITGLTDAQLKSGLPAGFDPKVWGQSLSINNGYPYLLANPPAK